MANQRKSIKAAQELIGAPKIKGYAPGRGNFRMTRGAKLLVAGFIALFAAVAIAEGRVLIPGGILLLVFAAQVRPYRAIALTDNALVVMSRSLFSGRPKQVIERIAPTALRAVTRPSKNKVRLQVGGEVITLRARQFDPLLVGLTDAGSTGSSVAA